MTDDSRSASTLCGVATGRPDGGVAIVRISGPRAKHIAEALVGPLPLPRTLALRSLGGERGLHCGEQALVVWMPGPGSFTGEDVVELHVHGGERNVSTVVEALLRQGAEAAGPGDFTRRAFEHGRLDLAQAEGIAAIIGARTDAALSQARRLVAGELGREVERVTEGIEDLRVEVEANLDFPEDVEAGDVLRWRAQVGHLADEVRGWLGRFEAGRRARERARIVVAGPPNAGKSSVFNRLLGRERTLVSSQAGTTRDYVEAEWSVGSFGAVLVDTAGLRHSDETLEAGGIERTREQLAGADVVIWIEAADTGGGGAGVDALRSGSASGSATLVRVENKCDLGRQRPGWLGISAKTGAGIDALVDGLEDWFRADADEPWIGLARHRDRAQEALDALITAEMELRHGAGTLELVAFQLAVAVRRVGEITGRHAMGPVGMDVLDQIFSRFCIGK